MAMPLLIVIVALRRGKYNTSHVFAQLISLNRDEKFLVFCTIHHTIKVASVVLDRVLGRMCRLKKPFRGQRQGSFTVRNNRDIRVPYVAPRKSHRGPRRQSRDMG